MTLFGSIACGGYAMGYDPVTAEQSRGEVQTATELLAPQTQGKAEYSFQIVDNLKHPVKTDVVGKEWNRVPLTQIPSITLSYQTDDPKVATVDVILVKGNRTFMDGDHGASPSYCLLYGSETAIIRELKKGESVEFDLKAPGRHTYAYLAKDADGNPLYLEEVAFDALFDDGKWTPCGEAEISAPLLTCGDRHISQVFGVPVFLDGCHADYPYYEGESWTVPIEFNARLQLYRIVNPLTSNPALKDYSCKVDVPANDSEETETKSEAFLFDSENPSWMLISAADPEDAYCEPTSLGMMAAHRISQPDFIARRYDEINGGTKMTPSPIQSVKTGEFRDEAVLPNGCQIIVKYSGWISDVPGKEAGVEEIADDVNAPEEYYTLDGLRIDTPSKGIYLLRKGSKISKVVF